MGLIQYFKDRSTEGRYGQYCIQVVKDEEYGLFGGKLPDTASGIGMDAANAALNFYYKEREFFPSHEPRKEVMGALGFALLANLGVYDDRRSLACLSLGKKLHRSHVGGSPHPIEERLIELTEDVISKAEQRSKAWTR